MPLTNIIGDLGSGKTIFLAYMAYIHPEIKCFSNFPIKLNNYEELTPEKILEIQNGLIFLDEGYTWLEARVSSGRAINQYLSYCLFQSRKREQWWFTTDQLLDTIDVRFRMMANYEIHCEAIKEGFRYRFFKLSRYKRPIVKTYTLSLDFARLHLFDIYESFKPVDSIDEDLIMKITKDKTNIIKEIQAIADTLCEKAKPKDYTLRMVKGYCLKNNIPAKKAELIFNELQERKLNDKYQERKI